jgi:ribosomal protein L7Ae-like RNA K-turn-binding protein
VKGDITAAVDEIIQSRCKKAQAPASGCNKDETLLNIVKMFESRATSNGKLDIGAPTPKAEHVAHTQDDIMLEKLNRDEDLADPVYWSDDERAPKSVHLPSAHKLGRRPRNDPATLRDYVMQDLDSQLDTEVSKLLLKANRFSTRHKVFETTPQVRYTVNGLKEVCRALNSGKVKCVVIAPDIEDSTSNGGVDDRIREILGSAYERDVPVVFALSRTRLGLALGKSLKMSVIGFLETKGMQEQFDHMVSSAYQQRVSWMERELPQKQTQGS